MQTANASVPVAQGSADVRRAEEFDTRLVAAHRKAYHARKRNLALSLRYLIADMFRESPRFVLGRSQRKAFDALFDAGVPDEKIMAIAEEYPLYVARRISERSAPQCRREALRAVMKEAGEAAVAQLVADQDPTPINRERAEQETRDVIRANKTYLMTLAHDVANGARAVCRGVMHAGERNWR